MFSADERFGSIAVTSHAHSTAHRMQNWAYKQERTWKISSCKRICQFSQEYNGMLIVRFRTVAKYTYHRATLTAPVLRMRRRAPAGRLAALRLEERTITTLWRVGKEPLCLSKFVFNVAKARSLVTITTLRYTETSMQLPVCQ